MKYGISPSNPPDTPKRLYIRHSPRTGGPCNTMRLKIFIEVFRIGLEQIRANAVAIHEKPRIISAVLIIIRQSTGQSKHLIIIRAAGLRLNALLSSDITAAVLMLAACTPVTMMLRMDILALETLDESDHKTLSASAACMHTKTYDTQRVTYHKQ
jgi:hypothetical protein